MYLFYTVHVQQTRTPTYTRVVQTRIDESVKFIKYALSKPGVYFVTLSDLVEWMSQPVGISRMEGWMQQRCHRHRQRQRQRDGEKDGYEGDTLDSDGDSNGGSGIEGDTARNGMLAAIAETGLPWKLRSLWRRQG